MYAKSPSKWEFVVIAKNHDCMDTVTMLLEIYNHQPSPIIDDISLATQAVRATSTPSFCEYIYGAMKGSWFGKEVFVGYFIKMYYTNRTRSSFQLKMSRALIP